MLAYNRALNQRGKRVTIPFIEENDQTAARQEHLNVLKQLVGNAYPNKFDRTNVTGAEDTITRVARFAEPIKEKHIPKLAEGERPTPEQHDAANAELNKYRVRVAGRLATPPRLMGKAAFVHLSDGTSRLQIYVRKQDVRAVNNQTFQLIEDENAGWELMNLLDHGDFVGVEGFLFATKTGESSIHVETLQFLSKAMLPMPDKLHGINDPELQRRFRYADLIADSLKIERDEMPTRTVFETRSRIISQMRNFLDKHDYIEVETPMLTPKATGAAAKPFKTHHNALDIDLFARIAPELYLKRLLVGGFERVYELNRNFRNEGLSNRHNPEFTMLEFYCAYMDAQEMMNFCEELLRNAVEKAAGSLQIKFEDKTIDFGSFERLSMADAIARYAASDNFTTDTMLEIFEKHVESNLIQPTFIVDFPKSKSPLSKAAPERPELAERFELFINGMECANGFSELNDPEEQYARFLDQANERERGDDEAMVLDEDYIRALSYGMPPAAGIGIGIDRLVMLLTNRHSIRDVILFPHMRPERKTEDLGMDEEGK